jgi:hypothetical protein
MEKMEEYLLDHFPFRDSLRRIKAYFATMYYNKTKIMIYMYQAGMPQS